MYQGEGELGLSELGCSRGLLLVEMCKWFGFLGLKIWVSFRGRINHNCQNLRRVFIIQRKKWLYIWERNVLCMDLGLFKELYCFLLFRAISCKMVWFPAYKASFQSFSFKLLPSEKLQFLLSESGFLFFHITSFLSKIFFEMISFFLWTGTIFLIALYLQIFSPAIVFEIDMDLIKLWKKFSLVAELFQSNKHMLVNFSQRGLL